MQHRLEQPVDVRLTVSGGVKVATASPAAARYLALERDHTVPEVALSLFGEFVLADVLEPRVFFVVFGIFGIAWLEPGVKANQGRLGNLLSATPA